MDENPTGNVDVQGHFGFPYAGLSVQKYNGSMASVKGTSKHIWHYENSGTTTGENRFGRYQSAGALEIILSGTNPSRASSGLGVNGWDWAHVPGTTVAYLSNADLNNQAMRQFNGKDFLAHASLDGNGIFAMDYKVITLLQARLPLKQISFIKIKYFVWGRGLKMLAVQHKYIPPCSKQN